MWQVTIDAEEGTIVVRRAVRLRARFRIGHHEHGGPAQNSDTSQPDPSTRRCTGGLSPFRPLRRVQPIPCLVHFALRGVPPAIFGVQSSQWECHFGVPMFGVPPATFGVPLLKCHCWSSTVGALLLECLCWSVIVGVSMSECKRGDYFS